MSFLFCLGEDFSERMPDFLEPHLPFLRNNEVYDHFLRELKRLYPEAQPPCSHYFYRTWKKNCWYVKLKMSSRFTVCEECESLRLSLRTAIIERKTTVDMRRQKEAHVSYIAAERICYRLKRDRTRLQSSDHCRIIVDGADQSFFGLPHFKLPPITSEYIP